MGLKVLNSIGGKSVSIVGGGGDRYEEGTPCIAGKYYYDDDNNRYKCIKDTGGSIPLSNTTPASVFGNISSKTGSLPTNVSCLS